MSIKDKAARLNFGASNPSVALHTPSIVATEFVTKTAPGAMMAFANDRKSEMLKENEDLKKRVGETELIKAKLDASQNELKAWDGAQAVRALDPNTIGRSQFANRHELNFCGAEFSELKDEIANAGKNIQPIKVRPVNKKNGAFDYEIVFGHRRHEACRQLGINVSAIVDDLDDQALFVEMDRENRARKDLSPWEQGVMYHRAILSGLFPSIRKLAGAIGADFGNIGKAISLAELPANVVDAFESPMDLQYRWAKPINDSLKLNPEAFAQKLISLASLDQKKKSLEVFLTLTSDYDLGCGTVPHPKSEVVVSASGGKAAVISMNKKGFLKITFSEVLSETKAKKLADFLDEMLSE